MLNQDLFTWLGHFATGAPWMVHADLFNVRALTPRGIGRNEALEHHAQLLERHASPGDVWMPSFNYDFARTGRFDAKTDPSQVGPLTEHRRASSGVWRTSVPIFSVTGRRKPILVPSCDVVDPFDHDSCFGQLADLGGTIILYGAPLSSLTLIHHAERAAGGPAYRYDKCFEGTVTDGKGKQSAVRLRYHVRPLGRALDYDWEKLERDSEADGILFRYEAPGVTLKALAARSFVDWWAMRYAIDPLFALEPRTRAWVSAELERLGRRFQLQDFESPA